MKSRQTLYISFIGLITIMACALPGAGAQPAADIPTVNMGQLETAIVETSAAAIALTSQAASPTPSPTSAPTETPTLRVIESAESTIIKQPEGAAYFIDKTAGYSITVPSGWIAVRINQQEYYDAWLLPEMSNPSRQNFLDTLKTKDPNIFRLAAVDLRDDHIVGSLATTLLFGWLQNENVSLESDFDVKRISSDFTSSDNFKPRVLSTSILTLSQEFKIGIIEWEIIQTSPSGEINMIYQKQVIFPKKTGGSTFIWLSTAASLKDVMLPEFDAMIATIAMQ